MQAAIAVCTTWVELANRAPGGLPRFVRADKPKPLLQDRIEVYVPGAAKLISVAADGDPARFGAGRQDGAKVVEVYREIPPGGSSIVSVRYTLELGRAGYRLRVLPQPLSHDPSLELSLRTPSTWLVNGAESSRNGGIRYSGRLDRPLTFEAGPDRRTGIPWAWQRLVAALPGG
jgi:hypothetical protein